MTQGLGWYLDSIGRVPLLTAAEEIELGTAIRRWLDWPDGSDHAPPAVARRGRRAKDRFVAANLRLSVNYVSKRCQRLIREGEMDDVIQAANLGLMRAVELFDPTRGYKFSTYAYWWIRQAVNKYADHSARLIRLPGLHNQHLAQVVAAGRELEAHLERRPTTAELSERTGLSERRIRQLLNEHRRLVSLDMAVGTDGEDSLGDLLAAPAPVDDEEPPELVQLRRQIHCLPPIHQQVMALRYGFEEPPIGPKEIASRLGLAMGEVRKIERQVLEQLRQRQQQPRTDHPQPERFADAIAGQLDFSGDLLSDPQVVGIRRRKAGSCGRRQHQLYLQRRHAPEGAVEQLALQVPVVAEVSCSFS